MPKKKRDLPGSLQQTPLCLSSLLFSSFFSHGFEDVVRAEELHLGIVSLLQGNSFPQLQLVAVLWRAHTARGAEKRKSINKRRCVCVCASDAGRGQPKRDKHNDEKSRLFFAGGMGVRF